MSRPEKSETIEHPGIVQKSDNRSVTVKISQPSACSGCHAEGSCSLTGKKDKIVEITGHYNLAEGDNVTVIMEKSMGYAAVLLGYLIPAILVVVILVILGSLPVSELIAGIGSIAALIPYYLILWFFREQISNKFIFNIKV